MLALLIACSLSSFSEAPPEVVDATVDAATTSMREVDVATFHADREAGNVPIVVDVRTTLEWKAGHVPGALHIPMDEVDDRLGELEPYKDGEVYLICHSGGRSGKVGQQLAAAGYSTVNVQGGTAGWIDAGYPVE